MDISNITTYQAGVAQSAAYRNLNRLFSDMLASHELTCMQWFVLGTIYDHGDQGIQMSRLADSLQTGLPFITNSMNILELKGMVVRVAGTEDSRTKYVSIAPAYKEKCLQIEADLRVKMRQSIYAEISPEDLRIYIKVLFRLGQIAQPG